MTAARASNRFAAALRALRAALEPLGIPHAIIGGIALNANGVARFTEDVDATIPGAGLDLARLLGALARRGIVGRRADVAEFARSSQVLLLTHEPSGIDVDLSLAWIPFELEAIERAVELSFGSARIRAARPHDLLIYKLIASRPQDVADAERLLLLFPDDIDVKRVRRVLRGLAQHLEGADRLAMLEQLLRDRRGARARTARPPRKKRPPRSA